MVRRPLPALLLAFLPLLASAQNLCPNPGAEEGQGETVAHWAMEGRVPGLWAADAAHTGQRSLKIVNDKPGATVGWLSPIIPVPEHGEFVCSIWAKFDHVSGAGGAYLVLYHMNDKGERIGQSGEVCLGGVGDNALTADWKQFLSLSHLTPEVKGIRVNLRLYGATGTAWFDDIDLQVQETKPLTAPRPLRYGLRVTQPGQAAIVSCTGGADLAEQIRSACRARGWDLPVLSPADVDLSKEQRDLIVLGNLASSSVAEQLYLRSYALEDGNFPGKSGYVLRPLVDPLGTGSNLLVVGASDAAGLAAGTALLCEKIKGDGGGLNLPLTVKAGPFRRIGSWLEAGAIDYLLSGDPKAAQTYREAVLKRAAVPDERLFNEDYALHLYFSRDMLSWDLMESCGVFTDAERLQVTQYLLKVARSNQGYGYSGLRGGRYSRENHGTRAARGFYYAWRYFDKYYRPLLGTETALWRMKLRDFWCGCLESSRTFEDSLSQHALGGSMVNILDIALQEPEWSQDFFASGRARDMGERCIAICDNLGYTVLLGDTAAGDYPGSVFTTLAYRLRDGRYLYMLGKRGSLGFSTDEPLRAFDLGLEPKLPQDHLGLKIIPVDGVYFDTGIQRHAGVTRERAFDKLSLRSGFTADDEYLMLDGIAGGSHSYDDANSLGEFSANGRRWLCEIDIFNGPTLSFHNAVTVARDGLGDPEVPQAAEVVSSAQGNGYAYTATRLPHYNKTNWTRHLLWLPGEYTFCLDELTAEEPGDYSFVLGWRSLGEPELKPGCFESRQDQVHRTGLLTTGEKLVTQVTAQSGKVLYHLGGYDALFYRADAIGDFVEVALPVPQAGQYELGVRTVTYNGRSTIQCSLDGRPLGAPIDLYKPGEPGIADTSLGTVKLQAGSHKLRFEVVGKNPQSAAYTFAINEVALYPGGRKSQTEVLPNRFRLVFPASVPATLDRDTETLGKYLPLSPHYERVLNVVEQSQGRALKPGESACFQNVFYAGKQAPLRAVELRRLNDHCALVRSGGKVALFGAGVDGVRLRLGALEASGKCFYLSPDRVVLHEATAALGGKTLSGGKTPGLAAALEAAWAAAAGPKAAPTTGSGASASALHECWRAPLPARPLSVAAYKPDRRTRVVAGLRSGLAQQFDAAGKPAGSLATGGPVYSLLGCDLDGKAGEELLVGSDDEHLYALRPDLTKLWDVRVPFLADEQPWDWWTLGSAKVRKLHAADLTGDGTPEILVGNGNMRLHCYDAAGKELWRFRTDHGVCTTITSGDLYGEGKQRVLAGNGLTSDQGTCWVLDEKGKQLQSYFNGSWCTALPAIALGDLDGDGKPTLLCGNNRGDLRAYPPARGSVQPLWIRNLTRPIRSLTIVPRAGSALVAVGSDSGYLCAFDQGGEKGWGRGLSSAITHTRLLTQAGKAPLLVAGCKDGQVFVVDAEGKLVGQARLGGRLEDLTVTDVNGDGTDEIAAAMSGKDALVVLALP